MDGPHRKLRLTRTIVAQHFFTIFHHHTTSINGKQYGDAEKSSIVPTQSLASAVARHDQTTVNSFGFLLPLQPTKLFDSYNEKVSAFRGVLDGIEFYRGQIFTRTSRISGCLQTLTLSKTFIFEYTSSVLPHSSVYYGGVFWQIAGDDFTTAASALRVMVIRTPHSPRCFSFFLSFFFPFFLFLSFPLILRRRQGVAEAFFSNFPTTYHTGPSFIGVISETTSGNGAAWYKLSSFMFLKMAHRQLAHLAKLRETWHRHAIERE